jgi:exodeoxyribonuclease V alpha subunit
VDEEILTGEVVRLTYHNPISAFTVAKLIPTPGAREIAIVGSMPMIQVGQQVRCTGTWEVDPKHGKQFSVRRLSYELPTHPSSIKRLIASGFLKGIGPVFAEKIVARFGAKTLFVLEHEPERLCEISGMGKRRADLIARCWRERTEQQELFVILQDWGISQTMALKIFRLYGNNALQIIKENPYRLAKEIRGIGFQAADKIAERLQIDPSSNIRLDAAIEYFLWELSGEGHTCIPVSDFLPRATERLGVCSDVVQQRIIAGCTQGDLVLFMPSPGADPHVALKKMFGTEQRVAQQLLRLMSHGSRLRSVDATKAIAWAEQTSHMQFAERQREAIAAALTNKITILTGGPGTGKSTITRAVVAILSKLTKHIVLAAPTGRAAKRLQEMTGRYSQTIHRLLKFNPGTGSFEHNADNPILCDLLIVDEMSMIDIFLSQALFESIPSHARVLIVGDVDQLPSIGPGSVLKDLIDSNRIPTVRLTEIYRQAKFSKIVENAHRINKGQMPFLKNDRGDFFFVPAKEPVDIRTRVLELVTQRIPDTFGFDPRHDIQILVPMRRGECGIDQLNIALQHVFSTQGTQVGPFLVNDKVIQMKNNYQKEVFNGDIGFVRGLDAEAGTVTVEFDERHVVFDGADLDELSLAWAVSIHKYQGSEAPCVVIPIHTQHFKLLNRNLLYTAVTRGKKLVILVGSPKAIAIAVHQETTDHRITNLQTHIASSFAGATTAAAPDGSPYADAKGCSDEKS